jgi:predicted nucleotidyltransferase
MNRDAALAIIKRHQAELVGLGVLSLSLFGSTARNEASDGSDVDIAVRLSEGPHGFAYFARLERIEALLSELLGRPVDVVPEPAAAERIQSVIERDRHLAF